MIRFGFFLMRRFPGTSYGTWPPSSSSSSCSSGGASRTTTRRATSARRPAGSGPWGSLPTATPGSRGCWSTCCFTGAGTRSYSAASFTRSSPSAWRRTSRSTATAIGISTFRARQSRAPLSKPLFFLSLFFFNQSGHYSALVRSSGWSLSLFQILIGSLFLIMLELRLITFSNMWSALALGSFFFFQFCWSKIFAYLLQLRCLHH